MSYGVESYGVGSYGDPAEQAGAGGGSTINCTIAAAVADGLQASISTMPDVDFKIAVIGDSNASGRCTNNQPAPPSGAYLYDNSGAVVALADPWDGGTNTYAILDDGGSADGSFVPRLAQHYYDAGKTTLWVPANKGGTQASNWTRSTLTTTHYGAMKARIDAVGGVDKIIICLGANDAIAGVSQSTFVTRINQLIADLKSDFSGASLYLQKIQDFAGYGSQVAVIRAAVQEVWENNPDVKRGADLDGITTSVHYTTDADAIAVGARTYAALEGYNVVAGTGAAAAAGLDSTVSNSSGLTVSCDTAQASAAGLSAGVANGIAMTCSVAVADAAGQSAAVSAALSISATPGAAVAAGYTAAIELAYTVLASNAIGTAAGFDSTISMAGSPVNIACALGQAMANGHLATVDNALYIRAPSGGGSNIIQPTGARPGNTTGQRR